MNSRQIPNTCTYKSHSTDAVKNLWQFRLQKVVLCWFLSLILTEPCLIIMTSPLVNSMSTSCPPAELESSSAITISELTCLDTSTWDLGHLFPFVFFLLFQQQILADSSLHQPILLHGKLSAQSLGVNRSAGATIGTDHVHRPSSYIRVCAFLFLSAIE